MRDDALNERNELDTILDAALSTYVDAEPEPGLVRRVIGTTIESARPPRVSLRPLRLGGAPWVRWVALAACFLIAIFLARRSSSPHLAPVVASHPSTSASTSVVAKAAFQADTAPRRPARHEVAHATSSLPKLEVFPTPIPLTPREQAFLKVRNRHLEEVPPQAAATQTVQSVPHSPIEPIHIAAIHIPPLNPPDNGSN